MSNDQDGFPEITDELITELAKETPEPTAEIPAPEVVAEVFSKKEEEITPEEQKKIVKAMAGTDIMSTENGMLIGKTIEGLYRIAKFMCLSKMVPKHYDTVEKVMAGMQYAVSLNLNPFISLRQISVVNGQPSLWGDLPLGLVRRTGQLEYIKEFQIDKNYAEISFQNKNLDAVMWACVCIIKRVGFDERTFTFTDLDYLRQGAGVDAIWKKFKPTMYMRKARGSGLKAEFSDVLEGVLIAEYDFNILPEEGRSYNVDHDGRDNQKAKIDKMAEKMAKADVITTAEEIK